MTGIKINRIFAAASTTRQKVKKSMILRDFENSSLRQRTVNVLLRNRKSCNVIVSASELKRDEKEEKRGSVKRIQLEIGE